MFKRIVMGLLAALFLSGLLTACNTMRGMGQDMERGGEKIQNQADKR